VRNKTTRSGNANLILKPFVWFYRLAISSRNSGRTGGNLLLRWCFDCRSMGADGFALYRKVSRRSFLRELSLSCVMKAYLVKALTQAHELFLTAKFMQLKRNYPFNSHTLRNLNDWTIQLGMTRRHSYDHYSQKIKVKKVIPHPQYNELVAHDNDIALFQVSS
jgi:Trypsin